MASGQLNSDIRRALRTALGSRAAAERLDTLLSEKSGRLAGATITIGAEATNVRAITIQLLDEEGADLDHVASVTAFLFTTAAMTTLATNVGSAGGGMAIGTDGLLPYNLSTGGNSLPNVFQLVSEADGDIDLTWTDTGTHEVFLALLMPTGDFVVSASIQNQA